jgi:hypothetical protein
MVIKLTRDVEVGRMGEVMDLPYQRATYLIRMGAALEWKQTNIDDKKITDDGSNTKKRVTRKGKANHKP